MKEFDTPATVLVVAPDDDMRRSLAFLLSAEGYCVVSDDRWPPIEPIGRLGAAIIDAVVIDHGAFDREFSDDGRLAALGGRVIVLVGRDGRMPPLPHAALVRKPLLDRDLLDTLRNALTATVSK